MDSRLIVCLDDGDSVNLNNHSVMKRFLTPTGIVVMLESISDWTADLQDSGSWTHAMDEGVIKQHEKKSNSSGAGLATAKKYASQAEYTIIVIGEEPYEEKSGNLEDLALPTGQIEYVKEQASTGTKVIVVLFEGRPHILKDLPENVHAVLNGMLACELGCQAVAEIIYGDVNPSGCMPINYPKDTGNLMIPYNHRVTSQCASRDYLTNNGSEAGREIVMLFLKRRYPSTKTRSEVVPTESTKRKVMHSSDGNMRTSIKKKRQNPSWIKRKRELEDLRLQAQSLEIQRELLLSRVSPVSTTKAPKQHERNNEKEEEEKMKFEAALDENKMLKKKIRNLWWCSR
ncbi:Lysosomal beta glucosidase [Phytophthora cinnamomi]|uniref:Lysosomal beta glucosidase n=1 Tax=Phytophthora cinnamomi TaxID=4785 RepID=UPI00355991EC|nr:Lysosomal beta glucosidase [Phytophthora cinnamomi]